MNSIELTRKLFAEGYMSKEASIEVLKARDKIINEALYKEATAFFKTAGIGNILRRWRGGPATLGTSAQKANSGFWGKMQAGGKTPMRTDAEGKRIGAGWSDVGANMVKILALAGLTSAGAAGIDAVQRHRKDRNLQSEIERSYVTMQKTFPRIAEMDQANVRNHFEVLSRYAPSLAANPTVAGSFVSTQATRGIIDPAMVGALAKAQETIDKVRDQHGSHGLGFSSATGLASTIMSGG